MSLTAARFLFLMLLPVELHVESVADIQAKPGENVTLPCQALRDDVTLLMWNRTEPKTVKYVLFFRDNGLVDKFQDPLFWGRVELKDPKMKKGDASVVLKNITTSDSGTYECRIVEGNARRRKRDNPELISLIRLKVEDSGPTAGKQDGNLALKIGLPLGFLLPLVLLAVVCGKKLVGQNCSPSTVHCYSRTNTENR